MYNKRIPILIKSLFLLATITITNFTAFTQSDGCAGVPSLTVNTSCTNSAVSLPGSFSNGGLVTASCATGGNDRDDGWYSFTATSTSTTIDMTMDRAVALVVWSACGGGTELGCDLQAAGTLSSVTVATTIGVTYYVQLHRRGGNNSASSTGTICVYETPAASNNIGNGDLNTCSGTIFDSGGSGGSYGNSENFIETYCSDAGDCIEINFSSFSTESCCDELTIYNGPNTSSPVIGTFAGSTSPGTITSSTGCVTFEWSSDGSVIGNGWEATISCVACPAPTCTDGFQNGTETGIDCGGTCPACPIVPLNDECAGAYPVTVNPDFNCGSTTAGTVDLATASAQSSASCGGTEDDDVWFSFVATGTSHSIDILNAAGSTTDMYHSVWEGNCPALSLVAGTCSDGDSQTLTGLTAGNTYFIRVYTWTSTTGQNSTFDVCVGSPPPPPANDDCSGAYPVTVNPDFNCGSTTAGTVASATLSTQSSASCGGTEDDDVWFSFVATGTSHTVDILNASGSTTDMYHSVWEGNCPALSLVAGTCFDANSQTLTGLTIGDTYFIRVYTWTSTTGQTSTFDVCVGTPPPPPANDDCSGAYPVTVNPDYSCASTTAGTVASASPSSQSDTDCGGTENDDVWFTFVATGTTHSIDILNASGSTTDMYHSVWEGNCPALSLYAGTCSDGNNQTLTGLTPGETYFIRVYTWSSTTGATTSFDVCVGTPPPPPANDDCSGAFSATVNALGAGCASTTSGTVASASASTQSAASCGGTENDDVWFTFTATSTDMSIDLLNVIGSTTDLYHSVWTGNCPALTLLAGTCSDPNSQILSGLTIGTTYYIRVYSYTSTAGQTSSFDLCLQELGPCGSTGTNDYCNSPATLTSEPGTFSATTAATFTQDLPGNVNSVFCGSIENNSWYQFTATSTTEVFEITSVSGCTFGIQAEVYDITYTGGGCCDVFTSMSNCYNPASTALGTVTANGLTINQDYMLMIDGNGGANCDFTISNWTGVNILPVEMLGLFGYTYERENLLKWTTASEVNNDYFIIEKSTNGVDYEKIGEIDGSGNSSSKIDYEFSDNNYNHTIVYYRLIQVDFDGTNENIGEIKMTRELDNVIAYPNPSSNELTFTFNYSNNSDYKIEFIDVQGKVVTENVIINNSNCVQSILFPELENGLYFVRVIDSNGQVIETIKVVKE